MRPTAGKRQFLVLNAYAERISGAALSGLLADKLAGRGGRIEWGELALSQEDGEREIGMSATRWRRMSSRAVTLGQPTVKAVRALHLRKAHVEDRASLSPRG